MALSDRYQRKLPRMACSLFDLPAFDPRRLWTIDIKFCSGRVLKFTHRTAHRYIYFRPRVALARTRVMIGNDILRMLENSQHLDTSLTGALGLYYKKHRSRTVIS